MVLRKRKAKEKLTMTFLIWKKPNKMKMVEPLKTSYFLT